MNPQLRMAMERIEREARWYNQTREIRMRDFRNLKDAYAAREKLICKISYGAMASSILCGLLLILLG